MAPKAPALNAVALAAVAVANAPAPAAPAPPALELAAGMHFGTATEPFKLSVAQAEFKAGGNVAAGKVRLEAYLKKYFARTLKCFLFLSHKKVLDILTLPELNCLFPKKFWIDDVKYAVSAPKMIQEFDLAYLRKDPAKPQVYEEEMEMHVNTFGGWLHEDTNIKPTKGEAKLYQPLLDHINVVWAKKDPKVFNYIIRWFARAAQKQKNERGLYITGPQGKGKSMVFDILRKYVFGMHAALSIDNPKVIVGDFNGIVGGRVLMCLEEMPTVSKGTYHEFSNKLKNLVTGDTYELKLKYMESVTAKNLFSIAVLANHQALSLESSDRRWLVIEADEGPTSKAYFDGIFGPFEREGAGKAFWAYLQTIDLTGDDGRTLPITKSKQIQTMPKAAKWLKETYLLKGRKFEYQTFSKTYADFCEWAHKGTGRDLAVNPFSAELTKLGFADKRESTTVDGKRSVNKTKYMLELSVERMYELFNKSGWLTDADDIPFITGNAPRKVPPNQRRYSAKEIEEMFCMSVNEKIAAYEKKQREDHSWALEMANAFMKGEEEKMAQLAQARQVPKKLPVAPKKAPVASKKGPVKTATVPKPTKVVKLKDCEVHTYDWDELA